VSTITGGCQCGAVRYAFPGPSVHAGVCHCRMCQKAGGNFGLSFVAAPGLSWTRGTPGVFRSSPKFERGFCRDCGTPLFMRAPGEAHDVTVGSLDRPDSVGRIETQIGMEDKCRWFDSIADAEPSDRGYGDCSPEEMARRRSFQHPDHDTEVWPPETNHD
jgi:hypothetical protein